jgi:4-hydroxybenzoate polyprenyltransferase
MKLGALGGPYAPLTVPLGAIAGGVAAGIPLSQWFLLVMAFGSLFMAAGKRYAELQLAERTGAKVWVKLGHLAFQASLDLPV